MKHFPQFNAIWWLHRALFVLCLGILFPLTLDEPAAAACNASPARPKLEVPREGTAVNERRVYLEWKSVECATRYSVEVRKGSKHGRPLDAAYDLTKSKYTTRRLDKGSEYWWTVKACNDYGCKTSGWGIFRIRK